MSTLSSAAAEAGRAAAIRDREAGHSLTPDQVERAARILRQVAIEEAQKTSTTTSVA